jgi:hypothetical protein
MKSVINDLFPADSRARQRNGLVSESQERILTSPSHVSPLHSLGKKSEQVYCPYCKQTTTTRVESSDSRTTKGVNALLWIGMGDPFALSAFNWCQNIDHFCMRCNGYLARKPYRGQTQAIPEDSVLELPLGNHHERTELPADPNHVSELYGDRTLTVQREAYKEAVFGSHSPQSQGSRILNPAELDWGFYQPSLISHDQASVLTEAHETEPLDLSAGHNQEFIELPGERSQRTPELRDLNTIKRKPVELGSGRVQSTKSESQNLELSNSTTAVHPQPVPSSRL